jgi:hypothetical protein
MKLLIVLSFLLAITFISSQPAAPSQPTCEDCNSLVNAISAWLTSPEGVEAQVEVLLSKVCPKSSNPDECVKELPAFWTELAQVLWPEYYNPDAEWMCAAEGFCGGPDSR